MKKRIAAWILLAGFILLLVNIGIIGYKRMLSFGLYLVIAFVYLAIFHGKRNQP